jgi:hypothetical protein
MSQISARAVIHHHNKHKKIGKIKPSFAIETVIFYPPKVAAKLQEYLF